MDFAICTAERFSPCTAVGLGLRDLDPLLHVGLGGTDVAITFLLGDFDLGFVDGAGGGFAAEGVDVAGLIGDVLDVDVDEPQADFLQFDLDAVGNVGDQLVAVGVDFLDGHGGDDHAHLAEDDVLREFLDLRQSSGRAAVPPHFP